MGIFWPCSKRRRYFSFLSKCRVLRDKGLPQNEHSNKISTPIRSIKVRPTFVHHIKISINIKSHFIQSIYRNVNNKELPTGVGCKQTSNKASNTRNIGSAICFSGPTAFGVGYLKWQFRKCNFRLAHIR